MAGSDSVWEGDARSASASGFPRGGSSEERWAYLARFASLAPSGHNTQPWRFRAGVDFLEIWTDRTRRLAVADPCDRELIISCGAALGTLEAAGRGLGLRWRTTRFPEGAGASGADALVARAEGLEEGEAPSAEERARFEAIVRRRTNRRPFDGRGLAAEAAGRMSGLAAERGVSLRFVEDEAGKGAIAALVAEGDRIQASDPAFRRELSAWVRWNRTRAGDGIPGREMGMGDAVSALGPLFIRWIDWGKAQAEKDAGLARGAGALGVFATGGDEPGDWVSTGEALAATLLEGEARGVSASYLNQPVEVPGLRGRLGEAAGVSGFPQLLLRFGYGSVADWPPTPRRRMEEALVRAGARD